MQAKAPINLISLSSVKNNPDQNTEGLKTVPDEKLADIYPLPHRINTGLMQIMLANVARLNTKLFRRRSSNYDA